MKKMYKVNYEITGGRRIDSMSIFAENIAAAVAEFITVEQECQGFKWTMTEHSITSIERI